MSRISKYLNTVKYMKPRQIVTRVLRRFNRGRGIPENAEYKKVCETALAIDCLDCNDEYIARFSPEELVNGKIILLNHELKPDYSEEYKQETSPLLFFNLHYFEYAVALGAMYKKSGNKAYAEAFCKLYKKYISERKKYYSYVVSLQIPNILIALEYFENSIDDGVKREIYKELYRQYLFLLSHQETHLLGNHYFENLKAILIASRFFGEDKIYKKYLSKFKKEIKNQVLSDGMHEELSVMYHRIIAEDILRVYKTLPTEHKEYADFLKETVQNMLSCSSSLEKGMGKTPFFNDSADGVSKSNELLITAAQMIMNICPEYRDSFEKSGYYKLYDGEIALMADAGKIGPDYNAGHGHCDCLSFELSVGNKPLFVNSGTYLYQGEKRKHFRSTAAHNTVMLDNREQSECWQEHRVAGRISEIKAEKTSNSVKGSYKSHGGDRHKRAIELKDKKLYVSDSVSSASAKTVHSFLHVAPDFNVQGLNSEIIVSDICKIKANDCSYIIHRDGDLCDYSPEFYVMQKSTCIEFIWNADNGEHGYTVEF